MLRRTPLRRTSLARRRKPVRRVNAKRRAERHALAFGEQAARCRAGRCIACVMMCRAQGTPTQAHHSPSRGAGGTDADTVGLCVMCHAQVHRMGQTSFWRMVGIEYAEVIEWMRRGDVIDDAWVSRWHSSNSPVSLTLGGPL